MAYSFLQDVVTFSANLPAAWLPLDEAVNFMLDDYHLIDSKSVHDVINFLIQYLPATIHLVISGRTDPPLPTSRLRVQGEVNEVRTSKFSKLRFTKEIADLTESQEIQPLHLAEALQYSPKLITGEFNPTETHFLLLQQIFHNHFKGPFFRVDLGPREL